VQLCYTVVIIYDDMLDIQMVTAILRRWFWMRLRGWIKQVVAWHSPVWQDIGSLMDLQSRHSTVTQTAPGITTFHTVMVSACSIFDKSVQIVLIVLTWQHCSKQFKFMKWYTRFLKTWHLLHVILAYLYVILMPAIALLVHHHHIRLLDRMTERICKYT